MSSQKGIEAAGEPSKAKAQKAAFAAETEAYKDSHSLVSLAFHCYYYVISISVTAITTIVVVQELCRHSRLVLLSLLCLPPLSCYIRPKKGESIGFVCFTPSPLNNTCGASVVVNASG